MKKQYWYATDIDSFHGFFSYDPSAHNIVGTVYGPFNSLSEAKKDALEYQKATILAAQDCMDAIRQAYRHNDVLDNPDGEQ